MQLHHEPSMQDATKPGTAQTRTPAMKAAEETGGIGLLRNPLLNLGTCFNDEQRREKHVEGLLPAIVESLDLQAERIMRHLDMEKDKLGKYFILSELLSHNVTLFYHVVINNLEALAPIIYTPVVGEACQKFDRIYNTPLGMYLSGFEHRNRFKDILQNWPSKAVQIIVVTDGGRILGLGDLGTNGIGISIGKISLYVAGAGFHPEHSLPAVLDVGTDNEELRDDKFYLGAKKDRIRGEEEMEVVEEFCMAVKDRYPDALIQFEDFQTDMAFEILERMRKKVLCFNDDIQGTGAVVTTGFINGMKAQGTELKDARIVFFGAGSSAVGVAKSIASVIELKGGVSAEDAKKAVFLVDTKGLITESRGDDKPEHKKVFMRTDDTPDMKELLDVVKHVKPHALIGLAGAGPAFDQPIIEALCEGFPKPLVFPLSNPTEKAEITAENAYNWSKGQCIFASGTAFDPVEYEGKTFSPGQANNVLIFPGVGFGAVMVKAKEVTDKMFASAAQRLADYVPKESFDEGKIYPDLPDLRDISLKVATAVAEEAFEEGVAQIEKPDDLEAYLADRMWLPSSPLDVPQHFSSLKADKK
jgi:malic enzyme